MVGFLASCCIILAAILLGALYLIWRAPEGHQDASGFHSGPVPGVYESMAQREHHPRNRQPYRARRRADGGQVDNSIHSIEVRDAR